MLEKRLFSLVPESTRYIIASVVFKWLALMANVVVMFTLATLLEPAVTQVYVGAISGESNAVTSTSTQQTMDAVLVSRTNLEQVLLIIAAALIVRAVSVYLAQRMGDKAAFVAVKRIRSLIYGKLSDLGPTYAEVVSTSEAVQTSVEGAQQLQVYFGAYLPQLFYALLAPITLFILLVGQAGLPAAVLLICVPIIPTSIMVLMWNAKKVGAAYWSTYVDLGSLFLEAVQGLTTLKVYRADGSWHKRINDEAERFRAATMRLLTSQLRSILVMDLVVFMGASAGIIVAVWQLSTGVITFSAAFLIVFLSQEFFIPMRRLGSLFHTAMNGMVASRRMFEILDTPELERGLSLLDENGDIELEDVGYSYGDTSVVRDVHAHIAHGSLVALVGESGGGKSTLAGIIAGRRASYSGTVRIGDVELREAAAASLMESVTLVPTNGYLFAGTLRENLMLAKPDASDDELWDVLRRARVEGFVCAQGGLDLIVSEGGENLSGGQRQRVCLARALLHNTPIYVFDEATSNVDAESEMAINAVIAQLAGKHTVIVVAHRLASVVHADELFVVKSGEIVERGSHEQLRASGGVYTTMWEQQSTLAAFVTAPDAASVNSGRNVAVSADAASANPSQDTSEPAAMNTDVSQQVSGSSTAREPHRSGFAVARRMIGLVRPLIGWLALAIVLGSVGMLAAAFVPAFGAFALMDAVGHGAGMTLVGACIACAVCGIIRGPLHYGEQLCNHYIAFRLLAHVRDLVFSALRKLAPARLEGRGKGEIVSLVTSDIELLEVFYAHTISPIAIALVCTIVFEIFLSQISGLLALVGLALYAVFGIVVPLVAARACGLAGRASREAVGSMSAYVLDSLRGIAETIQYHGITSREKELDNLTDRVGAIDASLQRRSAASEAVTDVLVLVASCIMLVVSLSLVAEGELTFGAAFVATFTFFSSFGSVIAVSRLGTSLQATLASGARVLDLFDEEPECPEVVDGTDINFEGARADQVRFSYETTPDSDAHIVFDDVSCEFPAGEIVCISGRSGSGKSTLLKLLMRFWDVSEGAIDISHEDIRRVNTESLRANEAYMTQDTHLFVGTIRDNLLIARQDASQADLDEACEQAALTSLIGRLPKGYDTPVAELGDSLSGGERQRIGLARVFLSGAPFVLLDEPTSALDALNEAAVMQAVAQLRSRGKTVVLVSHRASTCSFADRFYSVERGRLS